MTATHTAPEALMTIEEVATWLRRSPATLHHWRATGQGPKSARLGKRLVYRQTDVQRWLDDQFDTSPSSKSPA